MGVGVNDPRVGPLLGDPTLWARLVVPPPLMAAGLISAPPCLDGTQCGSRGYFYPTTLCGRVFSPTHSREGLPHMKENPFMVSGNSTRSLDLPPSDRSVCYSL